MPASSSSDVVAEAEDAIETRIRAYSDVLLGVRALFVASDSVTREEFQTYIASLDLNRRYPGIQVIHYAQRVPAAQRQAFEEMVRNDRSVDPRGYPDFAAKPPGNRPEYVIVQYVEPMAGNEAALGLDLGGDAVRLTALERTRDSGQLTASSVDVIDLEAVGSSGWTRTSNPPGEQVNAGVRTRGSFVSVARTRPRWSTVFGGKRASAGCAAQNPSGLLRSNALVIQRVLADSIQGRPESLPAPKPDRSDRPAQQSCFSVRSSEQGDFLGSCDESD